MANYDSSFKNHVCKICGTVCKNRRSFGMHLSKTHPGYSIEKYAAEFYYNNQVPLCKCGCGGPVKWHKTKYEFNEYINGHNKKWTTDNQPSFTKEQVEYRNQRIKEAYAKNKEQITEKISKSVRKALNKPEWKKAQSNKMLKLWKQPGYRKKISKAQEESWQQNYDERYKKIFTKEFSKKISFANSKRKIKVSKQEKQAIKSIGRSLSSALDTQFVLESKDGYSKKYDLYIPEWNLLIELDGIYWHGLDRDSCYSVSQIASMANDLNKNRLAIENNIGLIRIALDDDTLNTIKVLSNIDSKEELYSLAYYVQDHGGVLKDERIPLDDNRILLSRDQLLKYKIKKGKDYLEETVLPKLVEYFSEYFLASEFEWIYPPTSNIQKALNAVQNSKVTIKGDVISGKPRAGNVYLKSIMKSYWHAQHGPAAIQDDLQKLEKVLRYRIGLNNSKLYSYELNGKVVLNNETFDITPKNVRKGYVVQRNTVSWFSPVFARDVWSYLLQDVETDHPKVWDPSAGFGARMLGFSAVFPRGHYICTEPANMTYRDLCTLKEELQQNETTRLINIGIINSGSEILSDEISNNSLDCVFTSPPYFKTEMYFDEPGQCWRDYPEYEDWLNCYLQPTISNAYRFLKKGRKLCLNVSAEISLAVIQIAGDIGFKHIETLKFERSRDHFSRKFGYHDSAYEPVLIFQK